MNTASFQLLVSTLQNLVTTVNGIAVTVNGALAKVWSSFAGVALVDAATVAVDMSTGFNFTLLATSAVGATRALGNPTNAKPGQRGVIVYTQDAAGSRTLTFGSAYVAPGGVASLSLTTTSNATNVIHYTVLPNSTVLLSVAANVSH